MSILKLALLGKELSHSKSPEVHEKIFTILKEKFSLDYTGIQYELIECEEECDLAQWIKTAPTNRYLGANITYPFKSNAFSLSDRKIGSASFIDSANCIRFDNNQIQSISTDGEGLLSSLHQKYPGVDLSRYHLVFIGSGSSARAAAYTLCTKWMPLSLTIASRTIAHAEELAEFCIAQAPGPSVQVMSVEDFLHAPPEEKHRCIIQCTPVGQMNNLGNLLQGFTWHETDLAIDLIYNPLRTDFLTEASHGGAKTLNGIGMLIHQAALSQMFWLTGLMPEATPLSESEYNLLEKQLT